MESKTFNGEDWAPTLYTKPLQIPMVSDGPKLRRFIDLFWKSKETPAGQVFKLDPWQECLFDALLERYPNDWPVAGLRGRLRYEFVNVFMGAQNGKTIVASAMSCYYLMLNVPGATVVGLAPTVAMANLVYGITRYVFENDAKLASRFVSTGTRGLRSKDGTRLYRTAPGKADAIAGITAAGIVMDEVFQIDPELYSVAQLRTSAIQDSQLLAISTAGTDRSVLLKDLYRDGAKAAAGDPAFERMGFFLWRGIEGAAVDDVASIRQANPSIACGRKDIQKTLNIIKTQPEAHSRQFVHNLFVASESSWMPTHMWTTAAGEWPEGIKPTHIALDRDKEMRFSTVTSAVKHEGCIYTRVEIVREDPSLQSMEEDLDRVKKTAQAGCVVLVAWNNLKLHERLVQRGWNVEKVTGARVGEAAATTYRQIALGRVRHSGSQIITDQLPYVRLKEESGLYKIIPAPKSSIEAVYSMVMSVYGAENIKLKGMGVY